MAMFLVPHALWCSCHQLWMDADANAKQGRRKIRWSVGMEVQMDVGPWEYIQPWCSESSKRAGAKELLCCDRKIKFCLCLLGRLESALHLLLYVSLLPLLSMSNESNVFSEFET